MSGARTVGLGDQRELAWEMRVYYGPGQLVVEVWKGDDIYALMRRGVEDEAFRRYMGSKMSAAATSIINGVGAQEGE